MKPYYEKDGIAIYHGDAASVLSDLESGSVEVLLTDPPYSSGGMMRGDRVSQTTRQKYVQSDAKHTLADFSGDTRDQLGYLFWVGAWLHETTRILVPGGLAAVFTDWRQLPTSCMALQSGGYVYRGIVPWWKPAARPVKGRWTNACEYVVWGTNGPRSLDYLKGSRRVTFPGFYKASPPPMSQRQHITQKPVDVLAAMLEIANGGTVLDPFMGSGSTLVAAQQAGCPAIGVELSEEFCEIAARRLEASKPEEIEAAA